MLPGRPINEKGWKIMRLALVARNRPQRTMSWKSSPIGVAGPADTGVSLRNVSIWQRRDVRFGNGATRRLACGKRRLIIDADAESSV
jgi:hypothetical protein